MARSMHRVIAAPANDFGKLADADPGRAATHDALGSEPSAHIAADVLAIAQGMADTQADLEILRNGVSDIAETLENKISDNGGQDEESVGKEGCVAREAVAEKQAKHEHQQQKACWR